MFRKIIFWMHLILGLTASLVILVMAVTGAIMAYEPQIVDFAEHKVRYIAAPAGAERLSAEAIVGKVQEAKPGMSPAGLTLNADPKASAVVSFGKDGGAVFVNPYTGEMLGGISKTHDFMHWAEDIHRRLGAGENGRLVTGAANAIFFVMVVSGFYLWWPKQWSLKVLRAITFFNPNLDGRVRDYNWHNVIGFWCSAFLLMTTLTGLVMAYPWANNLLFRLAGSEPPPQFQRPAGGGMKGGKGQAPAQTPALPYNTYMNTVTAQVPDWKTVSFRSSREPGGAITAMIEENSAPKSFMRTTLTLDAATGSVTKAEPFAEMNTGRKARTWVKHLHTGEAFGWVGQTFVFLAALGAVMLVWTGFAMSWYRFFKAKSKKIRLQ